MSTFRVFPIDVMMLIFSNLSSGRDLIHFYRSCVEHDTIAKDAWEMLHKKLHGLCSPFPYSWKLRVMIIDSLLCVMTWVSPRGETGSLGKVLSAAPFPEGLFVIRSDLSLRIIHGVSEETVSAPGMYVSCTSTRRGAIHVLTLVTTSGDIVLRRRNPGGGVTSVEVTPPRPVLRAWTRGIYYADGGTRFDIYALECRGSMESRLIQFHCDVRNGDAKVHDTYYEVFLVNSYIACMKSSHDIFPIGDGRIYAADTRRVLPENGQLAKCVIPIGHGDTISKVSLSSCRLAHFHSTRKGKSMKCSSRGIAAVGKYYYTWGDGHPRRPRRRKR